MADSTLAQAMGKLLDPSRVLSGEAISRAYECDAYSVDKSKPTAVILPISTFEIAAAVKWCVANDVPFTPRGAGTGLSGGALPARGGLVISTKKLTQILEIDLPNRQLHAQTGIANKRISDAVADHGLHFAPDPSSQTVATLGGNIAENSGGPHTLKYGVTAQHVGSLTLVTAEGEIVELGSRVPGEPGPDFVALQVGGEGTVGLVTEAWVQLTPLPKVARTALIAYRDVRGATETVAEIIARGVIPAALEIMDRGILAALRAAFGLQFAEGTDALLLIECDGDVLDRVESEIAIAREIASEKGAIEFQLAANEAERQKLWTARKKGIGAMGRLAPTIVTHDGVIPRSKLPEMLDFVYETAARYDLGVANLFHAGDGNLHPCFYFDDRVEGVVDRVVAAGEAIMERCIELGGSVTGEHGIGVEKLDLMAKMFSAEDLAAQARVKAIFNRGDLCNPCKVLPTQKSCVEHRARWRGVAW
jgi:glycolate oxidase